MIANEYLKSMLDTTQSSEGHLLLTRVLLLRRVSKGTAVKETGLHLTQNFAKT